MNPDCDAAPTAVCVMGPEFAVVDCCGARVPPPAHDDGDDGWADEGFDPGDGDRDAAAADDAADDATDGDGSG